MPRLKNDSGEREYEKTKSMEDEKAKADEAAALQMKPEELFEKRLPAF